MDAVLNRTWDGLTMPTSHYPLRRGTPHGRLQLDPEPSYDKYQLNLVTTRKAPTATIRCREEGVSVALPSFGPDGGGVFLGVKRWL